MKNKIDGGAILLLFIVGMFAFCVSSDMKTSDVEDFQENQIFDTSVIENNWCGEPGDGTIRMVGAWVINDNLGLYTLEDETGNYWEIADVSVSEDDFLLLWIADCGTPETEDDLILKCWAEVH